MNVYLLIHDDRWYDMGDMSVRGVYATKQDAEMALPSTPGPYGLNAHSKDCCSVQEFEVEVTSPTNTRRTASTRS